MKVLKKFQLKVIIPNPYPGFIASLQVTLTKKQPF